MGAKRKKSVFKTAEIVALAAILAAILFVLSLLIGQMNEAGRSDDPFRGDSLRMETPAPGSAAEDPTESAIPAPAPTRAMEQTDGNAEQTDVSAIIQEAEPMKQTDVPSMIRDNGETKRTDVPPFAEETGYLAQKDAGFSEKRYPADETEGDGGDREALTFPAFLDFEPVSGDADFADGVPLLEVHFLDVDRNDAILIRCGDESAFIDCGAKEYAPRCVEYMRERGIDHLKYYIGTHAHADHVGGAGGILAAIETDLVLINYDLTIRCMKDIALLPEEDAALERAAYQTVSVGDVFTVGGAKLTCIGPVNLKRLSRWHDSAENTNSLVFRLEYGQKSFLLTGDADTPSFYQILKNDPDALRCTVFKNPHHNGKAGELVQRALEAEYIVIQTSADHPPVNDYVKALRNKGICPLIVSKNNAGTTAFFTDGQTLHYTTRNRMGDWSLSRSELTLRKGEKKGVARNMVPKNMIDTLMWTTSDETVAFPDPNYGTVNAVSPGECVITATAFDGTTRSVSVTVR